MTVVLTIRCLSGTWFVGPSSRTTWTCGLRVIRVRAQLWSGGFPRRWLAHLLMDQIAGCRGRRRGWSIHCATFSRIGNRHGRSQVAGGVVRSGGGLIFDLSTVGARVWSAALVGTITYGPWREVALRLKGVGLSIDLRTHAGSSAWQIQVAGGLDRCGGGLSSYLSTHALGISTGWPGWLVGWFDTAV